MLQEKCSISFLYESVGRESVIWEEFVIIKPASTRYSLSTDREVPQPIPAFVDSQDPVTLDP